MTPLDLDILIVSQATGKDAEDIKKQVARYLAILKELPELELLTKQAHKDFEAIKGPLNDAESKFQGLTQKNMELEGSVVALEAKTTTLNALFLHLNEENNRLQKKIDIDESRYTHLESKHKEKLDLLDTATEEKRKALEKEKQDFKEWQATQEEKASIAHEKRKAELTAILEDTKARETRVAKIIHKNLIFEKEQEDRLEMVKGIERNIDQKTERVEAMIKKMNEQEK